jgi:hypothetical protein
MIRRWSRPLYRTIILALGWWLSICSAAPPDLQSYETDALLEVEYFSWTAFRQLPSQCAKEVQAFYIDYAYRAYEAGAIDKTAYNRALALAFTRVCILYERGADAEGATAFCKQAASHFDAWRPGGNFGEFRNEVASDDFHPSKAP